MGGGRVPLVFTDRNQYCQQKGHTALQGMSWRSHGITLWWYNSEQNIILTLISLTPPSLWRCSPTWARASLFTKFLDHTQRRTTVGRTPLDECSARRKRPLPDNTQHSQQTDIHATGGIRTHNLSRRAAADLRLRPRGHWDRHLNIRRYFNCG